MKKIILFGCTIFVLTLILLTQFSCKKEGVITAETFRQVNANAKGGCGTYPYNMNLYPIADSLKVSVSGSSATATLWAHHANKCGKVLKAKWVVDNTTASIVESNSISFPISFTATGLTPGSHTIYVYIYDNFGSMAGGSVTFTIN